VGCAIATAAAVGALVARRRARAGAAGGLPPQKGAPPSDAVVSFDEAPLAQTENPLRRARVPARINR